MHVINGDYWRYWPPSRSDLLDIIFPILKPDPAADTTSVGIRPTVLLERYVNVMPNPASTQAQVTSSFGLTAIEVYNESGVKVKEFEANGYSTVLDLRGLPTGNYILRIHTRSGSVTKHLAVRK